MREPKGPFGPPPERFDKPVTVEENEDLNRARIAQIASGPKPWYKIVGPGLITGAADDDPSGIGTYSQCGAKYGYGLLWLLPVSLPLMIAIQEMCGRLGLVTGKGIAAVMKEHYPSWLLYGSLGLLFFANVLNVFADLNVMAASAKMLFGLPQVVWLLGLTLVLIALQVLVPYRTYAKLLKYLCLALLGYVFVAFLPGVYHDWRAIAKSLAVPNVKPRTEYLLDSIAFLGTTVSPYLFFWQAGEEVEEVIAAGAADSPGHRKRRVKNREIRNLRADTVIGMVTSQLVAFFIMIATAGTLFVSGKTDINTAQDAALALRPLGPSATWVFSLCMIGSGMLAIPTLAGSAAYAAAEAMGWQYGLYRRFRQARPFYLTVAGVIFIAFVLNFFSSLSPIKALVYSAVVNGIVAVPVMIVLLLICNNGAIVGERTNGRWSNFFGGLCVILMGAASAFFIWALCAGKS